jgi:hypothetical protein
MLNKDKEFAGRISDINQQVQSGDVEFEQAQRQETENVVSAESLNNITQS